MMTLSRSTQSCNNNQDLQKCDGTKTIDDSRCIDCPVKRCNVGQYFATSCTCKDCATRPQDCQNMGSATPMFYYGCQGFGTTDDGVCRPFFFDCGPECEPGKTYENSACMPDTRTKRQCLNCSSSRAITPSLGITKFVEVACKTTEDAKLTQCTPPGQTTCPRGQTWTNCTEIRDGTCIPCTNWICNASTHFLSTCLTDKDSVCTPCTSSLQCNAQETYRTSCTQTSDHTCRTCTKCQLGVTYESSPCTNVSNRVCTRCTNLGTCPNGFFKQSGCTLNRNTVCYPCSRAPCRYGFFESAPCNAASDRTCTQCTRQCQAGKFMATPCNSTQDAECVPCSSPLCPEGYYRTACTSKADSKCEPCSFPGGCPAGHFQNRTCTALTDRQCQKCDTCPGNMYEDSACAGSDNVKCLPCATACSSTQYETRKCTKQNPSSNQCTACTAECERFRYFTMLHTAFYYAAHWMIFYVCRSANPEFAELSFFGMCKLG